MAFITTDLENEKKEVQTGNSFLDDLLEFIDEAEVEELELQKEEDGFKIETIDQANYITKKVKQIRSEIEEAKEIAEAQLKAYEEKVNAWLSSVTKPLERQEEFYLFLLEQFAKEKLKDTKKRSLKLIEGTLQFKKQQDKYEYDDKELTAFAEKNLKDYVRYKPSVDKSKLKKDGKVKEGKLYIGDKEVKGVRVISREDKFSVK